MISSLTKRTALAVSATALAVILPAASFALGYGPANRPTYTYTGATTKGADHVQFNSFTNTPNVGDERYFFGAKDAATTTSGGYQNTMQVVPGQEVLLRTYVHNNADASLNASGAGIAHNTRVRIALPTDTATSLGAVSYVSADNADNKVTDSNGKSNIVSDGVNFQDAAVPFGVSYVAGSAMIYNEAHPTGVNLSDAIVGANGTQIGYDQMNGELPGCFNYVGLVTIKVKISGPALTFTKQVTTPGSTNWAASLSAKPGDTTSWLLTYSNKSSVVIKNGTIADTLPAHLKVVPGSVMLFDSNHPNGAVLSDTALFTNSGQNVGDLAATNGGGYIRYRTTINNDFAATECNPKLVNKATAVATGTQNQYASAEVDVQHACTPITPPITPPVTPPTPTLPATGAEAGLAGLGGLSAIAYAGRAYIGSKKSLLGALRK